MITRFLLLVAVCLPVLAEERAFEIDGLKAKLSLPQERTDKAVLLLHGWNGDLDEVGLLFKRQADSLAQAGIASLRFNFSGEGARNNYLLTSTLDSRIAESEAAYKALINEVPDASYGVVGFSFGGLTSMKVGARNPDWFDSMVLWSAAESMDFGRSENQVDAVRQALATGKGTYTDWETFTLTREHLVSVIGVRASDGLQNYPGALLTIRGTKDFLASTDRKWLETVPTTNKSFLLIGEADHIFNVLNDPNPGYDQRVIDETTHWFERTLAK